MSYKAECAEAASTASLQNVLMASRGSNRSYKWDVFCSFAENEKLLIRRNLVFRDQGGQNSQKQVENLGGGGSSEPIRAQLLSELIYG